MSRAPTYDWRCRQCDSVNFAHTTVCANCKFDTEYYRSPTLWTTMASEGVPAWKRLVCYVFGGLGVVLFIVGALFMKVYFLTDMTGMAWSAAATGLGVLLLWITYKLYPPIL